MLKCVCVCCGFGERGWGGVRLGKTLTLAFSMTFANSPIQIKQYWGVTRRKQSPLFRDEALGSTSLVWTCRRPSSSEKEEKK